MLGRTLKERGNTGAAVACSSVPCYGRLGRQYEPTLETQHRPNQYFLDL